MKFRIVTGKRLIGPVAAPIVRAKRMAFTATMDMAAPGTKSFTEIKDGARVVDFQDVRIKGYLSTFEAFTKADRIGDYVIPGAFSQTIPRFMANPVLLIDHCNSCDCIAGSFTLLKEDAKGLYVEALLSNSPYEDMRDVRFKVSEGHLRSLSMGGIFHYNEDGRGIFKVDLFEGSLTPVPMNPDALISVRALTPDEESQVNAGGYIRQTPRTNGVETIAA